MTRYAAFLRGVNVGGVNLKMADVAAALTDAGFADVRTVVASGNVLLESSFGAAHVRATAEAALRERFGYDAWVLVYDLDTVRAIDERYPFERGSTDTSRMSRLSATPRCSTNWRRWKVAPRRKSVAVTVSFTGRYPREAH
ncbi:hypothetical protein I546_2797 [Mycobacterium kansasii 732]|nr:hypothetical protein I546_2797 [Mycobacterium kansasii 732]